MSVPTGQPEQTHAQPILLYNDECGVCRRIAHMVQTSLKSKPGSPAIVVRPIGIDPVELRALHPDLDIWDAYARLHLLMPDGSVRFDGEAVAEVLRNMPDAHWFAWTFALRVFGFRPFQGLLNIAYTILADTRPLFGCESCGMPGPWVKPIARLVHAAKALFGKPSKPHPSPHFTRLAGSGGRPPPSPRA